MNPPTALLKRYRRVRPVAANQDYFLRQGILKLLAVKDSDIRLLTLEQCRDAVDKSLHAGGAFSATIPLVALYYGGVLQIDVVGPTPRGADFFVLSKGNAVPPLAPLFAALAHVVSTVVGESPPLCRTP